METPIEQPSRSLPTVQFPDDVLYLTHGELHFVKENEKYQYFNLGALGVEPFRLYKTTAQLFLNKFHQGLKEATKLVQTAVNQPLEDGCYYEGTISENTDVLTGTKFQSRVVANVYKGIPSLALRSYVYLSEESLWHSTKRGVRLAIDQQEANQIVAFINEKMKPPTSTIKRLPTIPQDPSPQEDEK